MQLLPEQLQAMEYARRRGTQAPVESIRARVSATFRDLEALLDSVPEDLAAVAPAPSRWSIHEVVDHLVESHRRAVEDLAGLVSGESPASGPIPAGLVSEAPFAKSWSTVVGELKDVHRRFESVLAGATEETSLTARAPIEMVVKCATDGGEARPVHWVEAFDWKACAILFRAHSLEHVQQIRRILAVVSESAL
jgi:hypothetical protein